MKSSLRVLSIFLAGFFATNVGAGTPSTVYHVSLRANDGVGAGTTEDPFNGNSPERLLRIFKEVPNGARILFAPGTYSVGTGLALSSGKSLSILGSNRTTTILKLRDGLPSGESRAKVAEGIILNLWGAERDYTQNSSLYIADLTLDANVGGSPHATNFTADALHTNYPTVVVERVNIINCGGSENYPTESFHVLAWYPNPDNRETRKWRWYQRFSDVHVVVRSGQTHTATVLGVGTANGQPPMVPLSAYSIIENSFFDISATQDSTYAIGTVGRNGAVFRNNVVITRDHATAMNADTWDHRGTTVEQNKFFLCDASSGVRLGSGPDTGTFSDDIIRNNQFFAASPNVVFAIQLNGITRVEIAGNQFLSLGDIAGNLTPVDVCNRYIPHKNESVVIRDNLLDTRLFHFPVTKFQGEPRAGVLTICENNRSIDGAEADGAANGLSSERILKSDISLGLVSAETQILTPTSKSLKVRLPRIVRFFEGVGSVLAGKRFTVINAGKYSLLIVSEQGDSLCRLASNSAVNLVATSTRWVVIGESR